MVKKGFSLVEALLVMVIISILFAAGTKVITTRPKPMAQTTPHGYYECYNDSGLKQRYVREGAENAQEQAVSQCIFEPPVGAAVFNLTSYSPILHSSFEPNINNKLNVSISGGITLSTNAAAAGVDGMNSISLEPNADGEEIRQTLKVLYPKSKLYNEGQIRSGIIIGW